MALVSNQHKVLVDPIQLSNQLYFFNTIYSQS